MRDRGVIIVGLLVFLGLITYPVWYNLSAGTAATAPSPVLPATEKSCVEPTEYMRTSHMDLLINWRETVVRNDDRIYRASDGQTYNMSLTETCMRCHESKAEFCDRCHNYAGVSPTCWNCHVDPALARRGEL